MIDASFPIAGGPAVIDRRDVLLTTLTVGWAMPALADVPVSDGTGIADGADPAEIIELWPHGAPGMPATPPVEEMTDRHNNGGRRDLALRGIVRPRMAVFRPVVSNGAAVLVTPGGGYTYVVMDKEGYETGRWLSARGYTVFVLFYRLPGDGWAAGPDVALSDAQRAMRIIRARAAKDGFRADRVVALGFSAGGHLCGDLATRFAVQTYQPVDAADGENARPDLAAPLYAVQSMSLPVAHGGSRAKLLGPNPSPALERAHSTALNVSAQTPPCFLIHAEDDPVVNVANTLEFRAALKAASVPVETHLFEVGGHGFGIAGAQGKPAAAWPELFHAWARSHGVG